MKENETKQLRLKDMNLDQIKTLIDDTINTITHVGHNITFEENNYETMKHNYEIQLLKLKYSDEYSKYKTVKEKEERSKIELAELKADLMMSKEQLNLDKIKLEQNRLILKYLFRLYDEKVEMK